MYVGIELRELVYSFFLCFIFFLHLFQLFYARISFSLCTCFLFHIFLLSIRLLFFFTSKIFSFTLPYSFFFRYLGPKRILDQTLSHCVATFHFIVRRVGRILVNSSSGFSFSLRFVHQLRTWERHSGFYCFLHARRGLIQSQFWFEIKNRETKCSILLESKACFRLQI